MDAPLLARKVKTDATVRCDFDSRQIPAGSYMTVIAGEGVKAQGKYCGPRCYHAALSHVEQVEKEQRV